jgi:hypothetical protein
MHLASHVAWWHLVHLGRFAARCAQLRGLLRPVAGGGSARGPQVVPCVRCQICGLILRTPPAMWSHIQAGFPEGGRELGNSADASRDDRRARIWKHRMLNKGWGMSCVVRLHSLPPVEESHRQRVSAEDELVAPQRVYRSVAYFDGDSAPNVDGLRLAPAVIHLLALRQRGAGNPAAPLAAAVPSPAAALAAPPFRHEAPPLEDIVVPLVVVGLPTLLFHSCWVATPLPSLAGRHSQDAVAFASLFAAVLPHMRFEGDPGGVFALTNAEWRTLVCVCAWVAVGCIVCAELGGGPTRT